MENDIFLPVLHSFENGNVYTGSLGDFRFIITPIIVNLNKKEVDLEKSTIKAECWHGKLCYEMSEIEAEQVFPMSPEGREAIREWLWERR